MAHHISGRLHWDTTHAAHHATTLLAHPVHRGRQILGVLALLASLGSAACPLPQRGSAQVVLAWDYTPPSPPIEGFLVQRRTGTGPWQEVGRVGATLRTVTDATAPRHTSLCYQVRAYRGQEHSPPSNEVCLTIPAATQSSARPQPEGRLPGPIAS
jgi:hypothetical protein